jgi:uncharacterized protein (DUF608 family)
LAKGKKPATGKRLNYIALPLGGIGAGMVCFSGTGRITHLSIRHRPEIWYEPRIFAAVHIRGVAHGARLVQGPDQQWRASFPFPGASGLDTSLGLPKFADCTFDWRFPFGVVALSDPTLPVSCEITGWSPFIPSNASDSSLPMAALEYRFLNRTDHPVEIVFSYHSRNFLSSCNFDEL